MKKADRGWGSALRRQWQLAPLSRTRNLPRSRTRLVIAANMTAESTPTPALALIFKYTDDDLRAHQKSISDEYTRLFKSCQNAGLSITGKRGERGTLVVFVDANEAKAKSLISWEQCVYIWSPKSVYAHGR